MYIKLVDQLCTSCSHYWCFIFYLNLLGVFLFLGETLKILSVEELPDVEIGEKIIKV